MRRRNFIQLGTALAAGAPISNANALQNEPPKPIAQKQTDFIHDGLYLSPMDYSSLLMKLADEGKIKEDYYSNNGVVAELENTFAKLLGKESAIFMPTGTLANHMAVRKLAGVNRRVIVQEQSHFFNDSGDCAQTLSGLTLIPLGENKVSFSIEEVEKVLDKSAKARVETKVGVISIETPVRRQQDRMFAFEDMKTITDFARNHQIKTHLDGARLFVQSVHTNKEPAAFGGMFDTVYTSLWKFFNAASGAILAGPKSFTENMFHERRMFGGSLPYAWPYAAVALHYAEHFIPEYKKAWANAEKFFAAIQKDERCSMVKLENGSHIVRLNIKNTNLVKLKEALEKKNILFNPPDEQGFMLKVNPSMNYYTAEELGDTFLTAMKGV
jgi:threonine aldolase